ncbi:MAG TPA: transglycosylase domain-containing protein [Pseudomonadota bacterium]|nr:transglycosylase domain-containing protein [Pseudomonadota bacterium]
MSRLRIQIVNPADGGFFYWLFKYYLFAALGLLMVSLHVLVAVYVYFARTLPETPDLSRYAHLAPGITEVYSGDGSLLATLASERREILPLDKIPQSMLDAVIAIEDRRFYEHRGLDLRGFVRAMRVNFYSGRMRQGGSTLTQQVAKAFLGADRTVSRKIREAILARRLEARYSKAEILQTYLNHTFLGHGSYGVQAAAKRFFDKNIWDLPVEDQAVLAGLLKAPTRYSPIDHPQAAQQRRNLVLRKMVEVGKLDEATAAKLYGKPIVLQQRRDISRDVSPYFVNHVRKELIATLGERRVMEDGLQVETTVQPFLDVLAGENVDFAVRRLDKRQGYRGAEANLDPDAQRVFQLRAQKRYADPLKEDTLYLGLVTAVRPSGATVQIGPHTTELPLNNMLWAARYNPRDPTNDRLILSAFEALKPGDVIWVKQAFRSNLAKFSDFVYAPITPYSTPEPKPPQAGQPPKPTPRPVVAAPAPAGDRVQPVRTAAAAPPRTQAKPGTRPAGPARPGVATTRPGGRATQPGRGPGGRTTGSRPGQPGANTKPGAGTGGTAIAGTRPAAGKPALGQKPTGGTQAKPPQPAVVQNKPSTQQPSESADARPQQFGRPSYVPGTGVYIPSEGDPRRAGVPAAQPGKRQEVGEAVWLPPQARKTPPGGPREVLLEQSPRPQGALLNFDIHNGYVLAMAGGSDYDRSEFNRVIQACRQPGSAYKPIYYSLALDRGYSYDTMWNDKVKVEIDPVTGEQWLPTNIDGSYGQQVNLERALVWSKNPPALEVFKTMGKKDVEAWARRLGMTTPIHADDALALGASCVRVDELSKSFALFGRSGRPVDLVTVKRVVSRSGEVLIDNSAWDDPMLDGKSRIERIMAQAGRQKRPVIAPRTAYLTGTLLRRVVSQGHSKPIRDAALIAAGKTGTSSRTSDVWFVGFTSRWLTSVWIGDDTYERQLGYADASFTLSVPMWARYMFHANRDAPLAEVPDRPATLKPTDRGGPLLPGFLPPPSAGLGPDGKPYALPENLRDLPTAPKGSRPPKIF